MTSQKTAAKETKNADVEENILPKFSWRRKGILLSHISVVGLSIESHSLGRSIGVTDWGSRSAIDLSIDCMLSSS